MSAYLSGGFSGPSLNVVTNVVNTNAVLSMGFDWYCVPASSSAGLSVCPPCPNATGECVCASECGSVVVRCFDEWIWGFVCLKVF